MKPRERRETGEQDLFRSPIGSDHQHGARAGVAGADGRLAVPGGAVRTDALKPSDLSRVIVDTTVQPKNVMFPTDARLLQRAREILVRLARKHGVELHQSYRRVGKFALIKRQRYAHAKLGRLIRLLGAVGSAMKVIGLPSPINTMEACGLTTNFLIPIEPTIALTGGTTDYGYEAARTVACAKQHPGFLSVLKAAVP
jgi:hypothetical protein